MTEKEKLEEAKRLYQTANADQKYVLESLFPELAESEDERISREITEFILTHRIDEPNDIEDTNSWLVWLEKQGDTSETIDRDKFAQGVLRGAAINLITWIDYNAAEGDMCLSNTECKDIEDALVSGNWNKIYAYMKKKLEKQDEKKHIFDFTDWQPSKVDGKVHNIYNSGVEPKFHEGTTITIPKDLKGTDTDGGVVGEKGEQDKTPFNRKRLEEVAKPETLEEKVEYWQRMHDIAMKKIKGTFKEEDSLETKAIKEQIENLKKRIEDTQLGCIVQRLDKIIELLQSAMLVLPQETYIPPIICKRPLDPNPNTLGGWETTANTFGSDYDIDTDKIKQDETNKSKS